jgi:steroid 5-alpha reductase family enzyme
MNPILANFIAALLLTLGAMVAVWSLSVRIHNASIVDIAWSAGFTLVNGFYLWVAPGLLERKVLLAVMVTLWSLRLAVHLAIRIAHHHPVEDARYTELRQRWAPHGARMMFGFFQLQGLLLVVLSIPFLLVAHNTAKVISPLEWAAFALWILAFVGEAVADFQLKQFKAQSREKGSICQKGLWNYSRHPNYFFEWLIWLSFFVFAISSPHGWTTFFAPALMLFFLLKVTGIPYTEELALRTRGESYRRYQQSTSMFVPWFKRKL